MKSLKKKNIIITGGNGFLGRYFCEAVSENGGNPIVLDLNTKGLPTYIKSLKYKYKNEPSYFKCDITKYEKLNNTYLKIKKKYKNINGLVNNAAINPKIDELDKSNLLESFDTKAIINEFHVGVIGALNCIKLFGNHFAKNKGGSIINISSDLGIIAPNQSLYNSSDDYQKVKPVSYSIIKSGIIGLTKYTSTYWAKKNVRCNCIAPGGVFENQDKNFIKKISEFIPMNRMSFPHELKGPIVFLLSNESSYVNGHTLVVDGGRTIW